MGVYFEAVDACGHLFMEDAPPKRPDVSAEDFAAFHETVDRCYEYQDGVLADLLRLEGPQTVTIVVSDHGFKSGDLRPQTSGRADTGLAPLWHRLHGVVFLHGRGIVRGKELTGASVLDVAPTVLAILGIPSSHELPGHPLTAGFAPGGLPEAPAAVSAYAPLRPRRLPADTSADPEAVRKLAALGYLGGGTGRTIAHDPDGRTVASYLNEGAARAAEGDDRGALVDFRKALDLDPRNVNAMIYAARIYMLQGDEDRARELGDRAVALNPNDTATRLQRAAWAIQTRHFEMAQTELDAASRLDDRLSLLHLLRARLEEISERHKEALDELAVAESLTDSEAYLSEILVERAAILAATGRSAESDRVLTTAAGVAPPSVIAELRGNLAMTQRKPDAAAAFFRQAADGGRRTPTLYRKLGKALAASGNLPAAEEAFRQAIAKAASPSEQEGAYGDLSIFYEFAGKESRVQSVLQEATAKLPRSAPLWGMLGAADGRAGRYANAVADYERSVALAPSPLACKTLATLLWTLGRDRPRAVALWKQSLSLDPAQNDVRQMLQRYGDLKIH